MYSECNRSRAKKIVGTVQTVGKNYYPSSNLKQGLKVDKDGTKKIVNIELYVNGKPQEIEDDKIYKMASSMYVLSETSGEDFAKGDSYEIIHDKAVKKMVTCSTKTIDEEMAEYFKGKGTIDLSNKVDPKKPRIYLVD